MSDDKDVMLLNRSKTFHIFDDYFEKMDLNEDIKKIYEIINDDELQDEFERQKRLTKLRNDNHKRYHIININKFKNLPDYLQDVIEDILRLYTCIVPEDLLNDNLINAQNNKKILDNIYRRITRLDRMVKTALKELNLENDKRQSKFNIPYFKALDISNELKKELFEKYNKLVLYNSVIVTDPYEDLKRQIVRDKYINDILKMLNLYEEEKLNLAKKDKLKEINKKIDMEIIKHQNIIHYIEDLMPQDSKHIEEFNNFKEFFNKIIAYDDTNYNNAKQTYEILSDDSRFKIMISNFEELFIEEIESRKLEEKFVFEKFGIKNIRTSLNYIATNYMDNLDIESKKIIEDIFNRLDSNNIDLNDIKNRLEVIVKNIWKNTITSVYSYNPNQDFYFICSNNQFIDEKYQTILITKRELDRVDDYSDYQIGFICGYNDNILYITENDDIMTVDYDDMSSLKTPIQLEQEFINFKVCNRIALNGFRTNIEAVYYINNGNKENYRKAVELANTYKLPLIELKKN